MPIIGMVIVNSIGFNTLFNMYITNTIKIEYKKK